VIVTGELAPDAHPLENAVYVAAAQPGGQKIAVIRLAVRPVVERIAAILKRQRAHHGRSSGAKSDLGAINARSLVPIVGAAKMLIGLSRGKPVGFLIALCLVSVVVVLAGFGRKPRRSRRGDAVLGQLRLRRSESQETFQRVSRESIAMAIGSLRDTRAEPLQLGRRRRNWPSTASPRRLRRGLRPNPAKTTTTKPNRERLESQLVSRAKARSAFWPLPRSEPRLRALMAPKSLFAPELRP